MPPPGPGVVASPEILHVVEFQSMPGLSRMGLVCQSAATCPALSCVVMGSLHMQAEHKEESIPCCVNPSSALRVLLHSQLIYFCLRRSQCYHPGEDGGGCCHRARPLHTSQCPAMPGCKTCTYKCMDAADCRLPGTCTSRAPRREGRRWSQCYGCTMPGAPMSAAPYFPATSSLDCQGP